MNNIGLGGDDRGRTAATVAGFDDGCGIDKFHQWVLNLPWVVNGPTVSTRPRVRSFAVDCEPLDRRRMWLLTDSDGARCSVTTASPSCFRSTRPKPSKPRVGTTRSAHAGRTGTPDGVRPRCPPSARGRSTRLSAYTYAMA